VDNGVAPAWFALPPKADVKDSGARKSIGSR